MPGGFITAAVIGGTTDVAFDAIDGNINSVGDAVKSFAWGAAKGVVSQGVGKALDKGIGKLAGKFAGKSGTGTKDIYRAVSPEEFDDIFATGGFRARPDGRSFQAKEFGNSFDETLEFANKPINLDKAAIVKVTHIMDDEAFLKDMEGSFKHKFAKKPEVIEGNMKALELALKEVKEI